MSHLVMRDALTAGKGEDEQLAARGQTREIQNFPHTHPSYEASVYQLKTYFSKRNRKQYSSIKPNLGVNILQYPVIEKWKMFFFPQQLTYSGPLCPHPLWILSVLLVAFVKMYTSSAAGMSFTNQ